ncbi:hypothetical protein BN1200_280068 [Klebsiella variicola]|nr:hypothetical protein KV8917_400036 [Klebsiella variicola]CTQ08663.1 hypothetical protein BN1200_280068 [Klebsiella variicola]
MQLQLLNREFPIYSGNDNITMDCGP